MLELEDWRQSRRGRIGNGEPRMRRDRRGGGPSRTKNEKKN